MLLTYAQHKQRHDMMMKKENQEKLNELNNLYLRANSLLYPYRVRNGTEQPQLGMLRCVV